MLTIHYLAGVRKTPGDRVRSSQYKEFIGHQLMLAREAVGLTQAKMARKYEMSPNKLNQWERGLYYPDPWFLKSFCNDYGFTTDWFYRGLKGGVSSERADDLRRAEEEKSEV
jgi:transcriptional regulator with XRE-family HTH domain